MNVEEKALFTSVLRDVSRSFYLTIRALPSGIRRPIAIAYLLARATDTVADTQIVKLPIRLDALQRLRARIEGVSDARLDFGGFAQQQGTPGERVLLQRIEEVLRLYNALDGINHAYVCAVLKTIISGQELDLERFAEASSTNIVPLQTDAELDDYTFRVAGCVGEFWTRVCVHGNQPKGVLTELTADNFAPFDSQTFSRSVLPNSIRFGKGLQLVNILRDIPSDLKNGRCYIPLELLTAANLAPNDLVNAANIDRFRAVYDPLLQRAQDHLAAGWEYTNTLPKSWVRVRLACAWPILIGLRTIAHLRKGNPLDATHRIKVTRSEVKGLMAKTFLTYPFRGRWGDQFSRALMPPRGKT
ncbi:MAG TPA: phytoene/squalene synthase family protein [Verrucomicrobiae bacterium]